VTSQTAVRRAPRLNLSPGSATRGKVVVWGLLTRHPFGGMIWQVLHHLAALRRLGFDVWYVEDSDSKVSIPGTLDRSLDDYMPAVDFLARHMAIAGFEDRWLFRVPRSREVLGNARGTRLEELYGEVDAAFNLCGAQELLPLHASIERLVYLQTDPVKPQIRIAQGNQKAIEAFSAYDHLFTYGANFGAPDCLVPVERFTWHPTLPPVILDWWATDEPPPDPSALTTIASWSARDKDVELGGRTLHWRKDLAYKRFAALPERAALPLEVALRGGGSDDARMLAERGWRLRPARSLDDLWSYRTYIQSSAGEFSVGKEQVVATRSGWFSDRTVCYLAAGRPAVVEDTGFSNFLPTGQGLLAFTDEDEALAAIEAVASDYDAHAAAAREIAHEFFDGEKVLARILERAGMS
jgi:hypothetical protein